MGELAQPLLAIEEQPKECRLEEEREHAFHRQRLPDHATSRSRKMRPIGAELEFHRNPSHDSQHKVDSEYLRPEPGGLVVVLVVLPECHRLQKDDQRCKTHCELGKQVVICDRECKMKAMYEVCAIHGMPRGDNAILALFQGLRGHSRT